MYASLFPYISDVNVHEIHLELGNRELAEVRLASEITPVPSPLKNRFIGTPNIVTDRIRQLLRHVPADLLVVESDFGPGQPAARATLHTTVKGVHLASTELKLG